MKKAFIIFLSAILLTACGNTMQSEEELIEKARRELPISDSDSINVAYAGEFEKDGCSLLWFISGNDEQAHYYLPMECQLKDNSYKFIQTFTPMNRGSDIAVMNWKNSYSFLINNQECKVLQIFCQNGEHNIEITEYPFIYNSRIIPDEYIFLDENGNGI